MARVKVLVFPCGSENASEIHQALMHSVHVELYGASSVDDHGRFRFERYRGGLPRVDAPDFDRVFIDLLRAWDISLVFATHDTVQEYLAIRAAQFGITLVNGDPFAVKVARRKSRTYELFREYVWSPAVYSSIGAVSHWPVLVKPDLGQGGQGVCKVDGPEEAAVAMAQLSEPLLVEYLPGEEITVDCFTDRQGGVLWVGPRTRERIRAGISMRSQHLAIEPEIQEIVLTVNARLRLRGPWFVQLKRDCTGGWKLLEISCRVAGTMVAQRAKGINLPLMAVHDYLERDLMVLPQDGVNMVERRIETVAQLNYVFDSVYIDFDETLVLDGKTVPSAMRFIYRMLELGKRLVLISRHKGSLVEALAAARISPLVFSEIIHLMDGELKSNYVSPNSIFIDNHFPERLDVSRVCGVPVFDLDALEFFN